MIVYASLMFSSVALDMVDLIRSKLGGRCAVVKRINYARMAKKIAICVSVFSSFLHRTTQATGNMHSICKKGEEKF